MAKPEVSSFRPQSFLWDLGRNSQAEMLLVAQNPTRIASTYILNRPAKILAGVALLKTLHVQSFLKH